MTYVQNIAIDLEFVSQNPKEITLKATRPWLKKNMLKCLGSWINKTLYFYVIIWYTIER